MQKYCCCVTQQKQYLMKCHRRHSDTNLNPFLSSFHLLCFYDYHKLLYPNKKHLFFPLACHFSINKDFWVSQQHVDFLI